MCLHCCCCLLYNLEMFNFLWYTHDYCFSCYSVLNLSVFPLVVLFVFSQMYQTLCWLFNVPLGQRLSGLGLHCLVLKYSCIFFCFLLFLFYDFLTEHLLQMPNNIQIQHFPCICCIEKRVCFVCFVIESLILLLRILADNFIKYSTNTNFILSHCIANGFCVVLLPLLFVPCLHISFKLALACHTTLSSNIVNELLCFLVFVFCVAS